jgi:hypothetical protein
MDTKELARVTGLPLDQHKLVVVVDKTPVDSRTWNNDTSSWSDKPQTDENGRALKEMGVNRRMPNYDGEPEKKTLRVMVAEVGSGVELDSLVRFENPRLAQRGRDLIIYADAVDLATDDDVIDLDEEISL